MLSILPPTLFASFSMAVRRPEPPSLSRPLVPSAVYDPTIMNLGMFDPLSSTRYALRAGLSISVRPLGAAARAPQSVALALRAGVSQYLHVMKSLLAMAVLWLGACAGGQVQRR